MLYNNSIVIYLCFLWLSCCFVKKRKRKTCAFIAFIILLHIYIIRIVLCKRKLSTHSRPHRGEQNKDWNLHFHLVYILFEEFFFRYTVFFFLVLIRCVFYFSINEIILLFKSSLFLVCIIFFLCVCVKEKDKQNRKKKKNSKQHQTNFGLCLAIFQVYKPRVSNFVWRKFLYLQENHSIVISESLTLEVYIFSSLSLSLV